MKLLDHKIIVTESKKVLSIADWRRRILFWGGGLTVGLVCVAFAMICDEMNMRFFHFAQAHPYFPFLITPIGFMIIVAVMRQFFRGTEGSGIPQTIAALKIHSIRPRARLVSLRIAVGKFFLTALSFACGGSIGREGPAIQLAASLMHTLGRWGKFKKRDLDKGLILAGGAAGVAAAFNTPLAGIVFAIEDLSGSFEKGVSGTIITTVVLCGLVAQYMLGNYHYFGTTDATLDVLHGGWIPIITMALMGGVFGGLFSLLLIRASYYMSVVLREHPFWVAGLLGLAVAAVGFISQGETYGSGYEAARDIITQNPDAHVLMGYAPFKMISTLLTYLSGIPGGIFAPSLSIGAGFGYIFAHFFPEHFYSAVILLATVAYFSGVLQSPITCFVIVVEMTGSTSGNMLLPIMLTSLMATGVSKVVCREPLTHTIALRYLNIVRGKTQ